MRRLIESLMPDELQIYWRWVGSMFAFYVLLMITAAGVFISHESTRKLAHENSATVASDNTLSASHQSSRPSRQVARFN